MFNEPIDIQKFLYTELGFCGCTEFRPAILRLIELLKWVKQKNEIRYDKLYNSAGIYYLLVHSLDQVGLIEHGVSIRFPWLTDKGEELLAALQNFSIEEIEDADDLYEDDEK